MLKNIKYKILNYKIFDKKQKQNNCNKTSNNINKFAKYTIYNKQATKQKAKKYLKQIAKAVKQINCRATSNSNLI